MVVSGNPAARSCGHGRHGPITEKGGIWLNGLPVAARFKPKVAATKVGCFRDELSECRQPDDGKNVANGAQTAERHLPAHPSGSGSSNLEMSSGATNHGDRICRKSGGPGCAGRAAIGPVARRALGALICL